MKRLQHLLIALALVVSGWMLAPASAQTQVWHWVNGVLRGPLPISFGNALSVSSSAVTSTVPILAGDGSASAPSYSFASDPTYGVYKTATALRITIAGSNSHLFTSSGFFIRSDSAAIMFGANDDVTLSRLSATALGLNGSLSHTGANGQAFADVQSLTELTTIAAAPTTDTTIQMPANSVVLGVSVRVTTVIPTATSFSVGDSGSATRFSTANVSVAAGSTDPGTKAGAYYNASALSIRLTMNGGTPAANTGRVRVTIYYYTITPPTS